MLEVPPRFELGSLDSKSRVLTITPWDRWLLIKSNFIVYKNYYITIAIGYLSNFGLAMIEKKRSTKYLDCQVFLNKKQTHCRRKYLLFSKDQKYLKKMGLSRASTSRGYYFKMAADSRECRSKRGLNVNPFLDMKLASFEPLR